MVYLVWVESRGLTDAHALKRASVIPFVSNLDRDFDKVLAIFSVTERGKIEECTIGFEAGVLMLIKKG